MKIERLTFPSQNGNGIVDAWLQLHKHTHTYITHPTILTVKFSISDGSALLVGLIDICFREGNEVHFHRRGTSSPSGRVTM